ncbi:YqjF family protein [Frondihabitans cladoniiphilus]|uniref:DUF2071 domain-containing protein n=1 Tax=Frondihabitans cladoniiphilus TaxID=715785 RepID=A0ABP8VJE0_9MICO
MSDSEHPPIRDAATAEAVTTVAPALPGAGIIQQRWSDLAFVHWRVEPERVAPLLPPGTRPDVFDGSTWVGLIGFELGRSAFGPLPPVPYFGTFPETNVRLYSVDDEGRRGVVFRSLEAAKLPPVLAARAGLGLPYTWADMSIVRGGGTLTYDSRRRWPAAAGASPHPTSHLTIRPLDEKVSGDPLADFLTARWGMHVERGGTTRYWRNEHPAWPLQRAELVELDDQLVAAGGLPGVVERAPDSVLYSRGVTTRFSLPERQRVSFNRPMAIPATG